MKRPSFPLLILLVLAAGFPACTSTDESRGRLEPGQTETAEIVVYGGTPGGVVAAVAAKRSGRSVILVEPSLQLGGIITGGLTVSDVCATLGIGATAREFFSRIGKKYQTASRWNFEPHVAEQVFEEMISEAGVRVFRGELIRDVVKKGKRILRLRTRSGKEFTARVFIDSSYEGDLLAAADVSYFVGRESKDTYGEDMAGVQEFLDVRQWQAPVSAYDSNGALLPGVHGGEWAEIGSGDEKVMAYNYRFCLTRAEDGKTPVPEPEGYDRGQYELLARYLKKMPHLKLADLMAFHHMYESKFCINRKGPFSTDLIGGSWEWPEASYEQRSEIALRHKEYTLGFLHFLANDLEVPEHIRAEMKSWGLCKDEFVDNGNFPKQLYVREGRRLVGEYVLHQKDLIENRTKQDVIGLASCPIEVHHVQRLAKTDGTVANEGLVGSRVKPYAIPYRSVTPKRSEVDNLLVPVAISASQIAYSSLRMEPVFMILGHSVGVAASMAVEEDIAVQDVEVSQLQKRLRSHTQVL